MREPARTAGVVEAAMGRASVGAILALPLLLVAALVGCILALNHGHFDYTLDDPYIHLALAEMLLHGSYGINVGEAAAPASSILYPFLLGGGLAAGLGDLAPLLIDLAALAALIALLHGYVRQLWPAAPPALAAAATVLLVLMVNGVGLVLTGMEHSLHLLATAAVAIGLARALDAPGRSAPWYFYAGIVFGPLLRFEGLAVSLAATLAALWCRRDRRAAAAFLVALALVGAHVALMLHLGLPPLPSSVLSKSGVTESVVEGSSVGAVLLNLAYGVGTGLTRRVTPALLVLLGLALWHARGRGWRSPAAGRAGFALFCLVAHLLAGRFGWFYRYEPYVVAAVLLAALPAVPTLTRWPARGLAAAAAVLLLAVYLRPVWLTPVAANNIEEQQYQMHRFATDFHAGPVAVNDLGWVSYRNDGYVLDIHGLGNDEARRARRRGMTAAWLDAFVTRHGATLAMVYDKWAAPVPARWLRLATLRLSRRRVAPAFDTVSFYATDPAAADAIAAELCRFAPTLPPGPILTLARPCR